MKIEIKNRWTGRVQFTAEIEATDDTPLRWRLRLAVLWAIANRADLRAANLREADLRAANLSEANLSAADLSAADLRAANLSAADLRAANLREADLSAANLSEADLREANLSAADLSAADLRAADLSEANLRVIRDDLWAVLCTSPREVPVLRESLVSGKVNGSAYEGDCACLVGTLANARHCSFKAIPGLRPDCSRPAERFFLAINVGDTPEKSQFARLAIEWIDQWTTNMMSAFGE